MSPNSRAKIEPLMGWTSSGDMRQQVHLRFDTFEEATAYCERHGIAYQIFHSKPSARRIMSYAELPLQPARSLYLFHRQHCRRQDNDQNVLVTSDGERQPAGSW